MDFIRFETPMTFDELVNSNDYDKLYSGTLLKTGLILLVRLLKIGGVACNEYNEHFYLVGDMISNGIICPNTFEDDSYIILGYNMSCVNMVSEMENVFYGDK